MFLVFDSIFRTLDGLKTTKPLDTILELRFLAFKWHFAWSNWLKFDRNTLHFCTRENSNFFEFQYFHDFKTQFLAFISIWNFENRPKIKKVTPFQIDTGWNSIGQEFYFWKGGWTTLFGNFLMLTSEPLNGYPTYGTFFKVLI